MEILKNKSKESCFEWVPVDIEFVSADIKKRDLIKIKINPKYDFLHLNQYI